MIPDQANTLRQLMRRLRRTAPASGSAPRLVAITGGHRASGATTLAINLAATLARDGHRVALVDADLMHGAVAEHCAVQSQATVLDVLAGQRTIHEGLVRGPAGVLVLPGAPSPEQSASLSAASAGRLITQIKQLELHVDVVVVDTGSSHSPLAHSFWRAADSVLVVTAPKPEAILDAYATIKMLAAGDASLPIKLFVNRAADLEANATQSRLAETCQRFLGLQLQNLGNWPVETAIDAATRASLPFVLSASTSPATATLQQIAEQLLSERPVKRPLEKPLSSATHSGSVAA